MKRRVFWIAAVVLGLAISLLSYGGSGPADASSLSKSSAGWSAARQYLEQRGHTTHTLDESIALNPLKPQVLVIAGSAAPSFSASEINALHSFLGRGGRVVFGYGDHVRSNPWREKLGQRFEKSKDPSRSLNPMQWRRETSQTRQLPTREGGPALALYAVNEYPVLQGGDEVLVKNEKEEPIVILRRRGKGEMFLVPVELFSNGRLQEAGNGSLLESLRARFGEGTPWAFDEYHHGVASKTSEVGMRSRRALDLFVFQILLAYGLFALAIGRRFGPEWPEPRAASGATGSFLMTIAALHERLGHHAVAAETLRERAHEVLGIEVPKSFPAGKARTGSAELVEVAQHVHGTQKEKRVS